jgi:hypothetical protein
VDAEITPMLNIMKSYSLNVSSFAYPNGSRNTALDNKLLTIFKTVRGTSYDDVPHDWPPYSLPLWYFNNSRVIYGIGVDDIYGLPDSYYTQYLTYAKEHNLILILYAHRPEQTVTGDYQTSYQRLQLICDFVKKNNMKFYTSSELYNMVK